jgi:hypothetical protein
MRRLGALLLAPALSLSACAVGVPQPPTSLHPFGTGIVLNAKVASSIDGPVDYWFRYGERGDRANWAETSHQTVEVTEEQAEPVSTELTELQPSHRYGWQVCVADRAEDPPRVVCSTEREFATVGDFVLGGHTDFNALSGPDGQNPTGTVAGEAVTCLRARSGGSAAVGVDRGVYHLKRVSGTSLDLFEIEFVAWPQGSDHADCPEPKEPEGTGLDQRIFIQDAP